MTPNHYDESEAEYIGGRKLCPLCEVHIPERQSVCQQCAVAGEHCFCGAELPMGPYGLPYDVCAECAESHE